MKQLKRAVAVLVWCVMSVGCVAGEIKQPASPAVQNESSSPDNGLIVTDIKGDKLPVTYRLAMNKNKPLCSRVSKSLPQLDYNGICDICNGSFDLFNGIKWSDQTNSGNNPTAPRYAIIDIDNDGKLDSVAHLPTSLQSNAYYFLAADLGDASGQILDKSSDTKNINNKRRLGIFSVDYPLDSFDEKPKLGTAAYQNSHNHYEIQPKNMMPFRFEDKTYIFMDSSTNLQWKQGRQSWIVISQYIGGEFAGSYKPGVFEDQCYFEVIFNKPYIEPVNNGEVQ